MPSDCSMFVCTQEGEDQVLEAGKEAGKETGKEAVKEVVKHRQPG